MRRELKHERKGKNQHISPFFKTLYYESNILIHRTAHNIIYLLFVLCACVSVCRLEQEKRQQEEQSGTKDAIKKSERY